jgi:hypothetical protein
MNKLFESIERLFLSDHYKDSSLHSEEFVGMISMTVEEFAIKMEENDFDKVNSTWVKNTENGQLHVFCYDGRDINSGENGSSYVYAHLEEPWRLGSIPKPDKNGPKGSKELKKIMDEIGVNYEPIRP